MTPAPVICAAPGCDKPVPRPKRTGRPAIYCTPDCRPTHRRAKIRRAGVVVEIQHPDVSPDGRPVDRVWTVRLRRGQHIVVLADNLGWPTANALARELNDLLFTNPQTGGAIN